MDLWTNGPMDQWKNGPMVPKNLGPRYPYITRSWFLTSLEGFPPSRDVGMPREPLYHLERRKPILGGNTSLEGQNQTKPTSLEGPQTIPSFTSLEGVPSNNTNISRGTKPYYLDISRGSKSYQHYVSRGTKPYHLYISRG